MIAVVVVKHIVVAAHIVAIVDAAAAAVLDYPTVVPVIARISANWLTVEHIQAHEDHAVARAVYITQAVLASHASRAYSAV